MSPEAWTARCFFQHLQRRVKKTPTPEGATELHDVIIIDRLDEEGNPFEKDPHDTDDLKEIGVHVGPITVEECAGRCEEADRPVRRSARNQPPRRVHKVHSAQRFGNIIEIIMWPENYDPALESQEVIAIRLVYKGSTQSGWAKVGDIGVYPLTYFDVNGPRDEKYRTRFSAALRFTNLLESCWEDSVYILLDGQAECNWGMVRVMRHTLLRADGELGSDKWYERTYDIGPDPYRAPLRWASEVARALRGTGHALDGDSFKSELGKAENQGQATLLQVLDSDFGFKGFGAVFKGEALEICNLAQAGPDTPMFDIMVANVGKKAVWPCNFLTAHQQKGFIQIGIPAKTKKRDQKLKAYVDPTVLKASGDWMSGAIKDELKIKATGEILTKSKFTPNVIGTSVHGFSSNGKLGDQKWYRRASEQRDPQEKAQEASRRHGRNEDRMRDIKEGVYGILDAPRDKGREIYVHLMKEFELESEIVDFKRPCSVKNTDEQKAAKRKRQRENAKLRDKERCRKSNHL